MNPLILLRCILFGLTFLFTLPIIHAQGDMAAISSLNQIPLELGPEDLIPGKKIQLSVQNSNASFVCSGPGNQSVGGFTLCADQTNAFLDTDRNNFWNSVPPPAGPSETYEYDFPSIETIYPCVSGATVDELIITITINSVIFNLGGPNACCEQYFEGVFGNLYVDCPAGSTCTVAGDGIVNNGNPGIGDCSPNGDNLNYDPTTSSFPLGVPYTAETNCLAGQVTTSSALGVDIVPSFFYQNAVANGCNCPTDLISQGFVSIDYDIEVEYVFCSNDLPAGCFPAAFDPVGPLCENEPAVVLPSTSNNGVSGTWSPASINPAGQGGNTITATFTPNPGQCVGGTSELMVMINSETSPTFDQIGPLCETDMPVPLPGTSNEGVTGTWDQGASFDPNGQGGNTVTITFTPDAGQCAAQQTMDIVVDLATVPTFAAIGPLCENEAPVPLPTTSTNGVNGTWNAGASFDPAGQGGSTVTITFTPDAGQCAATVTLDIQVNAEVVPTFSPIGPLCENEAPVPLPANSNNGISGTWDVGTTFDPSGQGGNTVTITFTPNAGECATTTTLDIFVESEATPTFDPIGPLCESDPPVPLPSVSNEGFSGNWDVGTSFDPAGQGGNVVTITFTPNAGQCASSTNLDIAVNVAQTPSFAPIGPLCESDAPVPLPNTSLNGVLGSWDVGTAFNPAGQGGNDVTITFTPTAGQCAFPATLTITVLDENTSTFSPIGPFCEDDPPFALPTQSLEGVSGTWDVGATFDPTGLGGTTTDLVFTPDVGQCAAETTVTVTVNSVPENTVLDVSCNASLTDYFVDFQTDGDDVSSTAGTVVDNGGGDFTIDNIPEGTDITVTVTNTLTGCVSTFDVTSPSCNCPTIDPPTGDDVEICEGEAIPALSVTVGAGLEVDWYDAATGGTLLLENSTTYTPPGAGSYFAEAVEASSNCVSNTRTEIELIVLPVDTTFAQDSTCNAMEVGVDTTVFSTLTCDSVVITTTTLIPGSEFFQTASSCDPANVGIDTVFLTNQLGCDSLVITETTLSPADTSFFSATTCDPALVGMDTTIFTTATCDSVVITTTTLLPPDIEFLMATSCNPNDVGLDTLVLTNQAGCDSLVITDTSLDPLPPTFAQATTCDPMLVGVDTTVLSSAGCDSLVITTTTLLPGDEVFQNATSCDPAEIGVDTLVLSNQNGCDSLIITTTTLSDADTTFVPATTCDPALVGVDTTVFTTATCDSIVITTTTLLPSDVTNLQTTSCDLTAVGLDTLVLQNQAGCDSLIITETIFEPLDPTFAQATSCDPMAVGVDTTVFSSLGCDSLVITTTTLLPSDETLLTDSSCDPANVGVDTVFLTNVLGCDSLIITTTTLAPADTTFVPATTCDPAEVGTDTLFLTNQNGCDSLVITNTVLEVVPPTFLEATSCDPADVGVDTVIFSTLTCDSLVITNTTLVLGSEEIIELVSCNSADVGSDTLVLTNQNGCDSLVITNTTLAGGISSANILAVDPGCLNPFGSISIDSIVGGEEPYLFSIDGGQFFTDSPDFIQLVAGQYDIVIEDANGCLFEASETLTDDVPPEIFFDPEEIQVRLGETIELSPTLTVPATALAGLNWTPGEGLSCLDCLNPAVTPLENITYTISILDENGCEANASVSLLVDERLRVYVPNVFSPNGDGFNDSFTILGDENFVSVVDELLIFDRWGDLAFENFNFQINDFEAGWDGMVDGEEVSQGVFVYLANITLVNGNKERLVGEIIVIR